MLLHKAHFYLKITQFNIKNGCQSVFKDGSFKLCLYNLVSGLMWALYVLPVLLIPLTLTVLFNIQLIV